MHVLGSYEASAQYSPINFFVNLFHSKNSNLPHCFSDPIHTEYRNLHKSNGRSPFFLPPIMRSSVGQCRNIRFRQLYASHVIITSGYITEIIPNHSLYAVTLLSYGEQIYISRFDFLLDPFCIFSYTCFVLIIVLKLSFYTNKNCLYH